ERFEKGLGGQLAKGFPVARALPTRRRLPGYVGAGGLFSGDGQSALHSAPAANEKAPQSKGAGLRGPCRPPMIINLISQQWQSTASTEIA
ncbi:hypothetical protein ACLBVB_33500, partial [Pseudomonas aeruginosa]|uniref:hypothetical protein n=1 Tax=Pseudomonas aeruginosa TaxID=287 RepID=UPI00396901A3